MIKLIREGEYKLLETTSHNKVLILDNSDTYGWITAENIGHLLVVSHKQHKTDSVLSAGRYRIYDVKQNPRYTDLIHLELHLGNNQWQGYLLLTGLPNTQRPKTRIIPTGELITKTIAHIGFFR
jgi:hypothetical protein